MITGSLITQIADSRTGQGREPGMLSAQYLENGWRLRLGSNPKDHQYEIAHMESNSHLTGDPACVSVMNDQLFSCYVSALTLVY